MSHRQETSWHKWGCSIDIEFIDLHDEDVYREKGWFSGRGEKSMYKCVALFKIYQKIEHIFCLPIWAI